MRNYQQKHNHTQLRFNTMNANINLTHNGQKYTIKCTVINTGSNYNKSVNVFKSGCKSPEFGTILKGNATPEQLKIWAINRLEADKNQEYPLLNVFANV